METIYFNDTLHPPPFGHMLEGAIGYISTDGRRVLYGSRMQPKYVSRAVKNPWAATRKELEQIASRGWPDGENTIARDFVRRHIIEKRDCVPKAKATPSALASTVLESKVREPARKKPLSARFKQCSLCKDTTILRKHHTRPTTRSSYKRGPIVRVCEECHVLIHQLFTNDELHMVEWDFVADVIKQWHQTPV